MRVFILTVGDNELVRLAKLFNFTLLVHSVGLLVVDEEVGGAGPRRGGDHGAAVCDIMRTRARLCCATAIKYTRPRLQHCSTAEAERERVLQQPGKLQHRLGGLQ